MSAEVCQEALQLTDDQSRCRSIAHARDGGLLRPPSHHLKKDLLELSRSGSLHLNLENIIFLLFKRSGWKINPKHPIFGLSRDAIDINGVG